MGQPAFTPGELTRYARHLSLPEIGPGGQARLRDARVLLVGAGGLGSPAALYLAAAGVGTLGIVDADQVDLSNLQRQILHGTGSVGLPKVESAHHRLGDLNPEVRVVPHPVRLTAANALDLVGAYDLVVDGSDNFPTRYLVNDAAVLTGRPVVFGSIFRFEGQLSVFGAPGGPCYRCLYPDPPAPDLVPDCAEAGVLGVIPGILGSLQALEAIKLITGAGRPLAGRLALFDGLGPGWRELVVRRDPACPACGVNPTIHALQDYDAWCAQGGAPAGETEIAPADLDRWLGAGTEVLVVDVREPWEWEIARIPGSVLVPLSSLEDRLGDLARDRPIVTVCHTGVRSQLALRLLRASGFETVHSLTGGVDAWACGIDPNMARY